MADNGFYADGCNVLLCYIIVRSRGRLNWVSNLIKHPTLATQAVSQAIRVWRVKYGWRPAGRFSRKLIRVLVIISHDPMSVVTRHTSHNQRGSHYPGSQEITMVSGGHPDNMTDRSLVWCLSGNVTNDKLRITRMRGSTAPTHSVTSEHWAAWLGWQWVFSTNRSALSGDSEPTSWDSWTLSSSLARSIYHDILLGWKINDEIIFRDLSTLQSLRCRQFRLR